MPSKTATATATVKPSSPLPHTKKTQPPDNELKQEETPPFDATRISSSDKENDDNPSNKEEIDSDINESGSESEEESSSDDDEMFDGLTKEEIAKVKAAMNQTKKGYNHHIEAETARIIKQTKEQIEFNLQITVNDDEAQFIAEFVEENNYNLEEQLQDEGLLFLQSMQEMMEQRKVMHDVDNDNDDDSDGMNAYDEDDEDWVCWEQNKKKHRAEKRQKKKLGKNTNLDGTVRCGRLLLNDALKNTQSMEGWSEARKKAWTNRKKSPNAYFYRFNVPGQPQRNGHWTLKEHELFMKRVRGFGVNDSWGLFSKAIPGRVGYQCSNFWRGLVKEGDVTDPNYHFDGKKLHFKRNTKTFNISTDYRKYAITINKDKSGVWNDLPIKHPKHPSEDYCNKVKEALKESGNSKNKNKKRKKSDDSDEDWNAKPKKKRRRNRKNKTWNDDDDEAFHCKVNIKSPERNEENDNPMSDFIDIMTGVRVVKPTISPYGHVLGYDTWTKVLRTQKHKNICPFTMQKMTRRSLIKLTKANYDEYKDKITNITKEQTDLLAQINRNGDNE